MNNAIKILQKMLEDENETPVHDGAGIITTSGVDASVRVKTIKECIRLLKVHNKDT